MAVRVEGRAPLRRMTEDEFASWDGEARAEFVDGELWEMSPVSRLHDDIVGFMYSLLRLYAEDHPCGRVFGSEFCMRLRPGLWRVPAMSFVAEANASRIEANRVSGPPDAVWEVISPDSEDRDWRSKLSEYEAFGMREYWIVNPYLETLHLYRLGEYGNYVPVEGVDARVESASVPGFWLKPEWLWSKPMPRVRDCMRELGALD